MLKILVTVLALMVAVSGVAWAGDAQGKIKSVDMSEKSFTLEDGTKVWVSDGMPMDKLKEGADVKASYDQKDGKNVATSIEVKE